MDMGIRFYGLELARLANAFVHFFFIGVRLLLAAACGFLAINEGAWILEQSLVTLFIENQWTYDPK